MIYFELDFWYWVKPEYFILESSTPTNPSSDFYFCTRFTLNWISGIGLSLSISSWNPQLLRILVKAFPVNGRAFARNLLEDPVEVALIGEPRQIGDL